MPDPSLWLCILILLLAIGFGVTNGFNDAANAIAASIGSRSLSPRNPIIIAAIFNLAGAATGPAVDCEELVRVREAVPDRNLLVGSGATAKTIGQLLRLADGVIVGTALKPGGDPSAPIDEKTACEFVEAALGGKKASG